ncbi:hypothetical protein N7493_004515 [Penicillium malachiteum]|uniref:AB hydrolase-1 domain-containing protein n=1 Tax=Penicillium malachiteum TaxID=1324776 RepID=A0AAD6HNQ4_9EURO|nr:hypothetical protein N7493_004515 [Penicillium malachiteum]
MPNTKTVRVPHLGGIDAAYQMPREYDPAKPTLVLVNSFTSTSEIFRNQFDDAELAGQMNLIAIELLGHGQTRTAAEHWTYWDTAVMNFQVLDALGIARVFVSGTSQGGFITILMTLLNPERIIGIIPVGTSMDSESERSRKLGCWDGRNIVTMFAKLWTSSTPTPGFEPDEAYCNASFNVGFNDYNPEGRENWFKSIKTNYHGDDGRRRARMAAIALVERGPLHLRLPDIRCPVLWLHGEKDVVFSVAHVREEIKLFTNSPDAKLVIVDGGPHILNCTHPKVVNEAISKFVSKYK